MRAVVPVFPSGFKVRLGRAVPDGETDVRQELRNWDIEKFELIIKKVGNCLNGQDCSMRRSFL